MLHWDAILHFCTSFALLLCIYMDLLTYLLTYLLIHSCSLLIQLYYL